MQDHEKKPPEDDALIGDVPMQTNDLGDTNDEDDSGGHGPSEPPPPPRK